MAQFEVLELTGDFEAIEAEVLTVTPQAPEAEVDKELVEQAIYELVTMRNMSIGVNSTQEGITNYQHSILGFSATNGRNREVTFPHGKVYLTPAERIGKLETRIIGLPFGEFVTYDWYTLDSEGIDWDRVILTFAQYQDDLVKGVTIPVNHLNTSRECVATNMHVRLLTNSPEDIDLKARLCPESK
jgi:hypothetical protein